MIAHRRTFRFRLYVAGEAQNSLQARANLAALCREHLAGRHEIEVVDVLRHPKRALADCVFMTPTLMKLGSSPARRLPDASNALMDNATMRRRFIWSPACVGCLP